MPNSENVAVLISFKNTTTDIPAKKVIRPKDLAQDSKHSDIQGSNWHSTILTAFGALVQATR